MEVRPEIAVREVAKFMGMSVSGARYHIDKMKKTGMIEHIGSTKKGRWIVHK
ncbi:MAG: winged helix-turn-helix transcriptional regulator [Lachnospiraceae bacterium]|nr:winged helix-turn-helix transcriptional regulator [Lachnospiraceae bacterium]